MTNGSNDKGTMSYDDASEASVHPCPGRNRVEIPKPDTRESESNPKTVFRAYTDEAASAAMQVAANAEARIGVIVAQRTNLTLYNLTITGAIAASSFQNNSGFQIHEGLAILSLLLCAVIFGVFTWKLGVSESYYSQTAATANHIVRKHFRIGVIHKIADDAYWKEMSWFGREFKGILHQRSYLLFVVLNFSLPTLVLIPLSLKAILW